MGDESQKPAKNAENKPTGEDRWLWRLVDTLDLVKIGRSNSRGEKGSEKGLAS